MPQPKGSNGMSLNGHVEHVVLADLGVAFDVETFWDGLRVFGEEMLRMQVSRRVMGAAYRQMQTAAASITEGIAERTRHVEEARRLLEESREVAA